jgi:hypothetical protein
MNIIEQIDDLITLFTSIPEERWCTGVQSNGKGQCCAYGHALGRDGSGLGNYNVLFHPEMMTKRSDTLHYLSDKINHCFAAINNGDDTQFQQSTPKKRVIAGLLYAKSLLSPVEISDPPVTIEDIIPEEVLTF